MSHVQIIAEIGTAHGGSIERCRQLIQSAKGAGADTAKFQIVYAREILHPKSGIVPLPGGDIPLYERFTALELPLDFYRQCKAICDGEHIGFLCTPFGMESAQELTTLSPQAVKIASPELNYLDLIHEVASWGVPLILSSGVSLLSDIEAALETAAQAGCPKHLITVLHCITSYPAPEEEYNLRLLATLRDITGVATGVSDHSLDPILVPALAVTQGATIIEKHICLSRTDSGLDDPIALDGKAFARMCQAVREAEKEGSEATIDRLSALYGTERIQKILGNGVKALAPSEKANYGRTNRSLHWARDIKKGETVRSEDVLCLRTEKILSVGLHPKEKATIIGSRLTRAVRSGDGIHWDDLITKEMR